jgi:type IV secretory pathway TrbL component
MGDGVARALGWCRRNPFTCAVFVIGTVAGAISAVAFEVGPEEMATWKRALGGALAGAWLAMFPLGFRLFE